MKRLTREIIQARIDATGSGVKIIGEYVDATVKSEFLCRCGETFFAIPHNVIKGSHCKTCKFKKLAAKRRIPEEEIHRKLEGRTVSMIGPYVSASKKTTFQCDVCGYTYQTLPQNVIRGSGCMKCNGKIQLTTQDFKERLKGRGIEVLGDYVNMKTKVLLRCENGHEWRASPTDVLHQKTGCPYCAGRMRLSEDEIDRRFLARGLRRIGPYAGIDGKVETECLTCGHVWFPSAWNATKAGGCPSCYLKSRTYSPQQIQDLLDEDGRGINLVGGYKSYTRLATFSCACGVVWDTRLSSILHNGTGCPACHSRSDSVYVWRSDGEYFNDIPVYKVGVTTFSNKLHRMRQCARHSGRNPKLIRMVKVDEPYRLEKVLLAIGTELPFSGFDDYTEMRAFTESQLSYVLSIMDKEAVEVYHNEL